MNRSENMKKVSITAVISALSLCMVSPAFASYIEKGDYTAQINSLPLTGHIYENKDHAHMFPLRETACLLGYEVEWEGSTQTATVKDGENSVSLTIGKDEYNSNGNKSQLMAAPELTDGLTYVPSLFFSKFFPVDMVNAENELIIVTSDEKGDLIKSCGTIKDASMNTLTLSLDDGSEKSFITSGADMSGCNGLTIGKNITVYYYSDFPEKAVKADEI